MRLTLDSGTDVTWHTWLHLCGLQSRLSVKALARSASRETTLRRLLWSGSFYGQVHGHIKAAKGTSR